MNGWVDDWVSGSEWFIQQFWLSAINLFCRMMEEIRCVQIYLSGCCQAVCPTSNAQRRTSSFRFASFKDQVSSINHFCLLASAL